MRIVTTVEDLHPLRGGCIAAIGFFDGVHRGHQKVIADVVARARSLDAVPLILTFEPHPQKIISSGDAPPLLQTARQKEELLESLGIEILLKVPFTRRLSLLRPEGFVQEILLPLRVQEVFVGENFRFGHRRCGDYSTLADLGRSAGFRVCATRQFSFRGRRISSTRIRNAIATGRVEAAARLLGRPYQITGAVIRGAGRGRTIGFPTANLKVDNELIPARGVYACRVRFRDQVFAAATNIGYRPTVETHPGNEPVTETFLLDFEGDLYGQELRMEFCLRLRAEDEFDSLPDLRRRIQHDVQRLKHYRRRTRKILQP